MELLTKPVPSLLGLFAILLLMCVNLSCEEVKLKPPSGFTDTLTINLPAAVFFSPAELQLKRLKEVTPPAVYESMLHDCFYQQRNAGNVIRQYYPAISIVEANNYKYICFLYANGRKQYINLDSNNDPCGIYLFDTKKTPKYSDMTNMESELGFYFKK